MLCIVTKTNFKKYHFVELTAVVEQMGLSVECSMVVFFSCLLFSKLRPGRDRELEAALASAASQKDRGDVLHFFCVYVSCV